jgi:positive regulator of sigma E activity
MDKTKLFETLGILLIGLGFGSLITFLILFFEIGEDRIISTIIQSVLALVFGFYLVNKYTEKDDNTIYKSYSMKEFNKNL